MDHGGESAMKTPDLPGFVRSLARFALYCGRRFQGDKCLKVATQLSYASLLAVVPILAICLGLLSAVPAFEPLRIEADETDPARPGAAGGRARRQRHPSPRS